MALSLWQPKAFTSCYTPRPGEALTVPVEDSRFRARHAPPARRLAVGRTHSIKPLENDVRLPQYPRLLSSLTWNSGPFPRFTFLASVAHDPASPGTTKSFTRARFGLRTDPLPAPGLRDAFPPASPLPPDHLFLSHRGCSSDRLFRCSPGPFPISTP